MNARHQTSLPVISRPVIELIDVTKSFGAQKLFKGVNFRIGPGDRTALVGPNGTGKTTLFRIILQDVSPDEGRLELKKGLRIGYLPQEIYPSLAQDLSIREYCIREARGVGALQDERADLLGRIDQGEATEKVVTRLAEVEDHLLVRDADALPGEADAVLTGLGFSANDLARPLSQMSGGLLMRVELARMLLDDPDVMILDEPINHLDLEGILWFEDYLRAYKGAVLIVAHDREFLNRTVVRIVEVSRTGAVDFGGSLNLPVYDRYLEERAKAMDLARKRYDEQQARIKDIEEFIVRNRVRKDRAQVVQSRIRALEKVERLEPPETEHKVRFRFPQPARTPALVLSMDSLAHRYGDTTVFEDLEVRLHRGEKVALVGVNGAGKSTLLRLVAGVMEATGGHRKLADKVDTAYYAQDQFEVLKSDRTVHQHMLDVSDTRTAPHVRGVLGAFLFRDDDVDKKVGTLSGGERARLMLSRILLQPHGLLVMDEPTNHLDIASREILENALKDYEGTVLFTTHDRRFMDTVCTAVYELDEGRLVRFEGNYSYYASKKAERSAAGSPVDTPSKTGAPKEVTQKDLEKARKRYEADRRNRLYRLLKPLKEKVSGFETDIEVLENELKAVEETLMAPDLYQDIERAREEGLRARELRSRLDGLYQKWTGAAEELQLAEGSVDEND